MTELPIDENTPRILIVEDEPKLGQLLIDYLRAASYAPSLIGHGDQVLPYVRQTPPDLILLDLMLPGVDGLTLCREIRRFSDVPIVMVTAKIEEIDRLLGLEIGADDYICKPYSPREVVARVKTILRRCKPQRELQVLDAQSPLIVDESRFQASWRSKLLDLTPAEFRLLADKRTTLEYVIDHLSKHASLPPDVIELPGGAPFGTVTVSDACTLCMSCTSACPAGALKAAADAPRLSFLERNCVQCGLCANTCPEQAITLTPRLLLKDRRHERLLREAEVFCCTACGKPMGAAPTILNMISKLSGHSMFATPEAKARLSMCGDCRVIDLIQKEDSVKAWEMTE